VALVTAEVPIGFVVVQVKVWVQLLPPEAMVQEEDEGVRVPDICKNVAVTVQLPVIAPVVKVEVPEPPQPVTEPIEYPVFGVTVKVVVEP
jgi:hypothetical protein